MSHCSFSSKFYFKPIEKTIRRVRFHFLFAAPFVNVIVCILCERVWFLGHSSIPVCKTSRPLNPPAVDVHFGPETRSRASVCLLMFTWFCAERRRFNCVAIQLWALLIFRILMCMSRAFYPILQFHVDALT